MRQNSNLRTKFPSYYRHDLLAWRLNTLGWSQREAARQAEISKETVKEVFKGRATPTKVYAIAEVLNVDWEKLHNLKLKPSEFHLALTNGSKSAG